MSLYQKDFQINFIELLTSPINYKNYGVDKIFLYDNNDITGESFDDVLSDFIKNQYIEIH